MGCASDRPKALGAVEETREQTRERRQSIKFEKLKSKMSEVKE
jgi:hypothetical protein